MVSCRVQSRRCWLVAMLLAAPPALAADEFTAGNILLSTENVLHEYTPQGVRVQSFAVPRGPWDVPARDICVDHRGRASVFNGTFDPYLSTLDPVHRAWTHETLAGWSTVNSIALGGIASLGLANFVTDMETSGGEPMGIIRFRDSAPPMRFALSINPIDLNIGPDGLLYALNGSRGRYVDVFDPQRLHFIRRIATEPIWDSHSVAIGPSGDLYLATTGSELHRFTPGGQVQATIDLASTAGMHGAMDVDVSPDGMVVAGDRWGRVLVTDTEFSSFRTFDVDGAVFVHVIGDICRADCDGSGDVDLFDFLCFQGLFAAGAAAADCDGSGSLDLFDFLCFQNEFSTGC